MSVPAAERLELGDFQARLVVETAPAEETAPVVGNSEHLVAVEMVAVEMAAVEMAAVEMAAVAAGNLACLVVSPSVVEQQGNLECP